MLRERESLLFSLKEKNRLHFIKIWVWVLIVWYKYVVFRKEWIRTGHLYICRTTRTHLMAIYLRRHWWTSTRKEHELPIFVDIIQYILGLLLINFVHLLWSLSSSLFNCCIQQSFFSSLCPGILSSTSSCYTIHFLTHGFLPNHSCPFLKHAHTITTYFIVALLLYHLFLLCLLTHYMWTYLLL